MSTLPTLINPKSAKSGGKKHKGGSRSGSLMAPNGPVITGATVAAGIAAGNWADLQWNNQFQEWSGIQKFPVSAVGGAVFLAADHYNKLPNAIGKYRGALRLAAIATVAETLADMADDYLPNLPSTAKRIGAAPAAPVKAAAPAAAPAAATEGLVHLGNVFDDDDGDDDDGAGAFWNKKKGDELEERLEWKIARAKAAGKDKKVSRLEGKAKKKGVDLDDDAPGAKPAGQGQGQGPSPRGANYFQPGVFTIIGPQGRVVGRTRHNPLSGPGRGRQG